MRLVSTHPVLFQVRLQLRVVLVIVVDGLFPFFALPVLRDLVEDLDFVIGGFQVMLCALLHLDSNVRVELEVFG